MAPDPLSDSVPMKRSSSDAELDSPLSLKQLRHYHRHHRLVHRQRIDENPTVITQDEEAIRKQLQRAVSLVLQAVGFDHAEPAALEAFQIEVEIYMFHFLASVRRHMLAARRIQAVPGDFLSALNAHHLTLRSLLVHLDPPVPASQSQPTLYTEDLEDYNDPGDDKLISVLLREASLGPQTYVPSNFPIFPSRHTYKAEPVFNHREIDPKAIRERATEEGRMGEEALRRLISQSARRDDGLSSAKSKDPRLFARQRARAIWRETMQAALTKNGGLGNPEDGSSMDDMEGVVSADAPDLQQFGPPINADSVYWRKPLTRRPDRKAAEV